MNADTFAERCVTRLVPPPAEEAATKEAFFNAWIDMLRVCRAKVPHVLGATSIRSEQHIVGEYDLKGRHDEPAEWLRGHVSSFPVRMEMWACICAAFLDPVDPDAAAVAVGRLLVLRREHPNAFRYFFHAIHPLEPEATLPEYLRFRELLRDREQADER